MSKAISYHLSALSQRAVILSLIGLVGCMQPNGQQQQPVPRVDEPLRVQVDETFQLSDADNWVFRTPELWKVVDAGGRRYLQMSEAPQRPMMPGVRRPQEYAIYAPYQFRSFSLSCYVRVDRDPATTARDAVIIFGRQDDTHLYYVHLSGRSDSAHNTIMRVDGATRKRLMPDNYNPPPIMTDREWHKVDVLRNCDTGLIQVYVDAHDPATAKPYFEIVDKTYDWGYLALGSFDDFASFAKIAIEGEGRKPLRPPTADARVTTAPAQ